jgi:hypothetical protein
MLIDQLNEIFLIWYFQNGHHDEYHLSSAYSDGGINGDMQEDLSDYETEEIQPKRTSPPKDISKPGTK